MKPITFGLMAITNDTLDLGVWNLVWS